MQKVPCWASVNDANPDVIAQMGTASFCCALGCGREAKDRVDSWTGGETRKNCDAVKKNLT